MSDATDTDRSTQTWRVGDVTVHALVETFLVFPPEITVKDVDDELLAAHADVLRPHYVTDDGRLRVAIQSYLVESHGVRIIVDTCFGNDRQYGGEPLQTTYLDDLAALGFARETVDIVLCTHLHLDHVGWNTMLVDGVWVPTFPNARYLFAAVEHAYWSEHQDPYVNYRDTIDPVVDAGLHDLVGLDHVLTPEVQLMGTPGHTPGHVSVRISSAGASALISGDMLHHPIQIVAPEICSAADWDEEVSRRTRREVLDDLAESGTLLLGTHFAEPAGGHVSRGTDTPFRFTPAPGSDDR